MKNRHYFFLLKKTCVLLITVVILLLSSSGCKKTNDEDSGPVEPTSAPTPVLNEPGPSIEPQEGEFTIAVLPDTQYYLSRLNNGTPDIFSAQIKWIKDNQAAENIVYVAHLGDLTEHGDNVPDEWVLAKDIMYGLENPVSIPYGIAVGNHDQYPAQYAVTGTTFSYNTYFAAEHFEGRPYYGGHYSDNNDSHYDLFSAGGVDFIVVYLEYDAFNEDQANMNTWAFNLLNTHASRKAIVVSHYLIGNNSIAGTNDGTPGTFRAQGQAIYDRLKHCPNVFMMLCGHVGDNGEGYRTDTFNGHTIRTFLSDYQSRENGGNGLMRLYRFSVDENQIDVKTFSPWTNTNETDGDSQFTTTMFD